MSANGKPAMTRKLHCLLNKSPILLYVPRYFMPRNPRPNPAYYTSAAQLELFVRDHLTQHKLPLTRYKVLHNQHLVGLDGAYQIDVHASFRVMGVEFRVLAECKRMTRALERDVVMAFHAKVQSLGAHKGIIYCTSGFQKGAIQYAEQHGLALVKVVGEHLIYETKSAQRSATSPTQLQLTAKPMTRQAMATLL